MTAEFEDEVRELVRVSLVDGCRALLWRIEALVSDLEDRALDLDEQLVDLTGCLTGLMESSRMAEARISLLESAWQSKLNLSSSGVSWETINQFCASPIGSRGSADTDLHAMADCLEVRNYLAAKCSFQWIEG